MNAPMRPPMRPEPAAGQTWERDIDGVRFEIDRYESCRAYGQRDDRPGACTGIPRGTLLDDYTCTSAG